ncbi:MurR/RpiR family transcriptional regulator [uncultured Cetobacterium sp.]|uniref:MurR/RpiR family transcriptional regulator n=1 Tax=uncultured Cetobacterium sp. TaxID=527638 RepID=UPI00260DF22A|nr:MurR/RpiR family transcriptional regulator [uncultured Cetobacterium sp.]
MKNINKIILKIEENHNKFTKSEIKVMNFILQNSKYILEHSIGDISSKIGISDATLSRFAIKIGFKGFNELRFILDQESKRVNIETNHNNSSILDRLVNDYKKNLDQNVELIKNEEISFLINSIKTSSRIKVYGIGSSGYFAKEMGFRLSKLGFDSKAITETHEMKIDANFCNEKDLIIGVSLSGLTNDVIESMNIGKNKGARTIAFTNYPNSKIGEFSDKIIKIISKNTLEMGHFISPQITLIFILDYIISRIILENPDKYFEMGFNTIHSIFKQNDLK